MPPGSGLPLFTPDTSLNALGPVLLHLLQEGILLDVLLDNPIAQLLLVLGQIVQAVALDVDVELVLGAQLASVYADQIGGHTKALGLVVVSESKVYKRIKRKPGSESTYFSPPGAPKRLTTVTTVW